MPAAVPAREPTPGQLPARKNLIIAKNIVRNWRCKLRLALGEFGSLSAEMCQKSIEDRLDYIDRVYRDYVFYGNLAKEDIEGRRILELGQAEDFGVALKFLTAGAGQVVVVDRFAVDRETEEAAEVYRAMRLRLRAREARRFDTAVSLTDGVRFHPERLQAIGGVAAEAASVLAPATFSLIVSRATLQEVHQIDRAFDAMDTLLEPGGRMLHKIDLTDYGMFSSHGMHPLEFLTVPEPLYTLMTEYSGQPNRWRADYYRRKMRQLGYFAGLLVTAVVGEPGEVLPHKLSLRFGVDYTGRSLQLIRDIRPRLVQPFCDASDEDLLATGLFLVARKPE